MPTAVAYAIADNLIVHAKQAMPGLSWSPAGPYGAHGIHHGLEVEIAFDPRARTWNWLLCWQNSKPFVRGTAGKREQLCSPSVVLDPEAREPGKPEPVIECVVQEIRGLQKAAGAAFQEPTMLVRKVST